MRRWSIISVLALGVVARIPSLSQDEPRTDETVFDEGTGGMREERPLVERGPAQLPAPPLEGLRRLSLWATYYSIPRVHAVADDGVLLLSATGRPLGPQLSPRDFCAAAMEGTVEVTGRDRAKRMFAFDGLAPEDDDDPGVDCSPYYPGFPVLGRTRFRRTHAPFGEGARRARLVPFRTIAVDPRRIPEGTVLYVPAARGTVVPLPTGENWIHDGYFYAADTGGAIEGNHIDVFVGFATTNPFFFVKSRPEAAFDAFVVEDPSVEQTLADAHRAPQANKT